MSLTYERGPDFTLSVYADANFAEDSDDRRSVSGVVVTQGSATVSWLSSTQKIVTLSTTEAEYVALGDGVKEALFAKALASFLVPGLTETGILAIVDNEGAINLASNPRSSARTKHIDVRFHFVREWASSGTIVVEYVLTSEQRVDILTKPLTGSIFREHRNFLMNLH